MRLTQSIRREIVRNIRSKIPATNYDAQIQKVLKEASFAALPEVLRKAINSNPDILTYLATKYVYGYNSNVSNVHYEPSQKTIDKLAVIKKADNIQDTSINKVMHKISACLDECNTVKRFLEYFPQFEDCIPYPDVPISNLPGNTIAKELTALGFPGLKKAQKKTP